MDQWYTMSKEDKQEFIAKYIESMTFEKNKNYSNGIHLIDIKLKSIFIDKFDRLSSQSLSQAPVLFEYKGKKVLLNVSYPLKESQLKDYLKHMEETKSIKFYMHPTFNYYLKDIPQEITFDLDEGEEPFKLIPVIKDIDNPESISNKFRLGIVTTHVSTIDMDSKE